MLVRRRLSLGDQDAVCTTIVRHEQFADAQAAVDLLRRAQEQAEALLLTAQVQRQACLDQATAEFWEQAGDFLQTLEVQSRANQHAVIEAAGQLLNVVIERLFDEASMGERARALLSHLAASQPSASAATLSCHPQLFSEVQAWLASSRYSALWQLREDSQMPALALRLSCENGEFDLDWAGLQRSLLAQNG